MFISNSHNNIVIKKNPGENLYKYVAGKATVAYESMLLTHLKWLEKKLLNLDKNLLQDNI